MTRLSTILSVLISLGLSATASAGTPSLQVAGCSGSEGQRVCVPVTLSKEGAAVASVGFTLAYDTSAMRLPGGSGDVVAGSALTGQSLAARVSEDPNAGSGRVQVVVTAPPTIPIPVLGDGTVCEVCFTVPAGSAGCQAPSFVAGSVDVGSNTGTDLVATTGSEGGGGPGGCEVSATLPSINCRLAEAIAAVNARDDLGDLKRRILRLLESAKARKERAEGQLADGRVRPAKSSLRQAVRYLQQLQRLLGSRKGQQLSDAARAAVSGVIAPLIADLGTVESSI